MWVGLFLILGLSACGNQAGMLHYLRDQKPVLYEGTHSLKQLQGERRVDILWVIDNSGSMGSHQANLSKNADIFINEFTAKGGLEWKMGVVSTDVSQPPFGGFPMNKPLDFRTPNAVPEFQDAIRKLGTGGDAIEQSFGPIRKHLGAYPDFLRKEATLAVIFLTDAPDQSRIPAPEIFQFMGALKGDPKKIVIYGAFAATDFGCQTAEGLKYAGSPYETLITQTKGKVYKLCGDFGTDLADLGRDLVTRVERPYIALPDRPQTATLRVIYKGKDLPGGPVDFGGYWIYDFDLNRIVFHNLSFAPGDNEDVSVSYEAIPKTP